MMLHVALVAEILATVVCIHCIYGRKVKLDVKTVGLILGIMIILEIANTLRFGGIFSLCVYVILYIYCKSEFKSSFVEIAISLLLYTVILTSMQFICMFVANIYINNDEYIRNTISNLLALALFIMILHTHGLYRLQKTICRNFKSIIVLLGFMGLIVTIILIQGKSFYEVQMQYFIFVIPALIMLLYIIKKWCVVQTKAEKLEEEICKTAENTKKYDDLLTKVRLCQHELKNHIAAILSAHYTYKTYEKLIQAQEEYCKDLLNENRYNNLLLLGDNILVGYLYGKFQEAEDDDIEVNYKIATTINKMQVPIYYVIEMLGILLDNAVEALKTSKKKVISFEVYEQEEEYVFLIKNPFLYVPYNEITEWFRYEKSEKGSGRGLGLYHLKCLCEEWNCSIGCRNIEISQRNWIEFVLIIGKTDDK